MRIRLVEGAYKEKFPKLYSCMNKIVCGCACKALKQRIERHLFAQSKTQQDAERSENDVVREREEDSKQHGTEVTPRSGLLFDERRFHGDTTLRGLGNGESTMRAVPARMVNSTIEDKAIGGPNGKLMKETIDLSKLRSQQFSDTESEKKEIDVDTKQDSITWPSERSWMSKGVFLLLLPMSLICYVTIPSARVPAQGESSLLALTYLISMMWLAFLAFLLSWWMASLSIALETHLLIIPFLVVPVGQLLRSFSRWAVLRSRISRLKKVSGDFDDLKDSSFKRESKDATQKTKTEAHKELLTEKYVGQIFLYTFWAGLMLLIVTTVSGNIDLETNRNWIKLLVLMVTFLIKGGLIIKAGFGTTLWLALVHLGLYCLYLIVVIIIEYA